MTVFHLRGLNVFLYSAQALCAAGLHPSVSNLWQASAWSQGLEIISLEPWFLLNSDFIWRDEKQRFPLRLLLVSDGKAQRWCFSSRLKIACRIFVCVWLHVFLSGGEFFQILSNIPSVKCRSPKRPNVLKPKSKKKLTSLKKGQNYIWFRR